MRILHLLALLPCPLWTAATRAQTIPNLIGPTLNTPVIHESLHSNCTQLNTCTPPGMPPPLQTPAVFYWPGGSAWDSATTSLWVTTGFVLGRYGMNGCTVTCAPGACPVSTPGAQATGLDLHDGANQLWILDDAGGITRCTNACPPAPVALPCNTGLGVAGFTATTAITIDELRGLVFYTTSDFALGSGTIHVAPIATPCAWFQATPVQDCFNNPSLITGIAVDAGNSALYWTNGRGTFRWTYAYNPAGPSVTFTPGTCCIQQAPFADPYIDLSIRWGGATSTGQPCANGACPTCPMNHLLRNAPLLGTTLQLGLDNAPVGQPAWCVVGVGSCGSGGGGTVIPPLCGTPLVPMTAATLTLGANVPTGSAVCNGTTTFLLPIPPNPNLVGLPLASQCVTLCPPVGTSMSNCLSFVLQ